MLCGAFHNISSRFCSCNGGSNNRKLTFDLLSESSTTLSESPLSRLPPEILLRILQTAAQSSQNACLSLCLVSSWVREIALQQWLSALVLDDASRLISFTQQRPWPSDYFDFLRGLWLDDTVGVPSTSLRRLAQCRNVRYLVGYDGILEQLGSLLVEEAARFQSSVQLRVTNLGIDLVSTSPLYASLMNTGAIPPSLVYKAVTHLHFVDDIRPRNRFLVDARHFEHLSHLAVPMSASTMLHIDEGSGFIGAVRNLPTVVAIVLVLDPDSKERTDTTEIKDWFTRARKSESRLLLVKQRRSQLRDVWISEVHGGGGIWERAVRYTEKMDAIPSACL